MKIKSIIISGLLLAGLGASTTSCEDMFTAENNLVSTDLTPQDTLWQMMGIVQRMQKLADRTILLGEVRADLVTVDDIHASADIKELATNQVSTTNSYNSPAEYYDVINNCNLYLSKVDSLLKTHGEYYYEREICAAKCFRAWCYLELAKIYAEVPFVTEPVLTSDAAEEILESGSKADMKTILDFVIDDLQKYPYMSKNDDLRQDYGKQTWDGYSYKKFFFPVRALLAELYLWRGSYTGDQQDYINAIRMYHDYFCFPDEEIAVGANYTVQWMNKDMTVRLNSYGSRFSLAKEAACVLPLDSVEYYGNTTDLRAVFNSQYSNNYYPAVVPSQAIKNLSKSQDYCYYKYSSSTSRDTIYGSHDANSYDNPLYEGDLRLAAVFNSTSNLSESQYNSNYNDMKYYNAKYLSGSSSVSTDKRMATVTLFRNTILYIHMAEALNRAGFPETSFAVLAYGLSYDVLNDRDIISQDEFDRLCEIKSYGFTLTDAKYTDELSAKTTGSFVIWPSSVFATPDKDNSTAGVGSIVIDQTSGASLTNTGIHSLGSGDTEYNKYYYLDDSVTLAGLIEDVPVPVYASVNTLNSRSTAADTLRHDSLVAYNDSLLRDYIAAQAEVDSLNNIYLHSESVTAKRIAHVKQLILDEEALEGAFEGYRFYDLLRYQMQEGKVVGGSSATISMPEYMLNDTEKYGTSTMSGRWYLKLKDR